MASRLIETYMREERLPHIWCAGCGHGILMRDVALAIDNLKLDKKDVVIVSGIGCSSRAAGYMNFDTLHTTHGRAIAFATGIKRLHSSSPATATPPPSAATTSSTPRGATST